VNAKVMKDPRIAAMMTKPNPFDMKRMTFGGFKVLVESRSPRRANNNRRRCFPSKRKDRHDG